MLFRTEKKGIKKLWGGWGGGCFEFGKGLWEM